MNTGATCTWTVPLFRNFNTFTLSERPRTTLVRKSEVFVPLSVCLFVGIKPEKLYTASCVGGEVNPLGVIAYGQRHKPRAYQRQWHIPRTCQSMVNTLQVDRLARITGLSGSYSTTHPQPKNGVPPCLVWRIGFGRGKILNDFNKWCIAILYFLSWVSKTQPNHWTKVGLSAWQAPD